MSEFQQFNSSFYFKLAPPLTDQERTGEFLFEGGLDPSTFRLKEIIGVFVKLEC